MIEQTLRPINDKDSYHKKIAQLIEYELYQLLYAPLISILKGEDTKENAQVDPVIAAINSGQIFYKDGFMYGKFSSTISKALYALGGSFHKSKKAFKISIAQLSQEIRAAVAHKLVDESEQLDKIDKAIASIKQAEPKGINFDPFTENIVSDLDIQFKKVTPKDLEVPLELDRLGKERLAEEYSNNLNLDIHDWTNKAILRLRDKVEDNVREGFRADTLMKTIQAEHGITKNKAKFIARQETSLLVAKYRQIRYEDAGVNSYRWSTSHDERVRTDHKELNNKVFSWDNPPITDRATGARNNPGQDFNCRCVALPIVRGVG